MPLLSDCTTFKEKVEEVAQSQENTTESEEATSTANLLDNLSVGESKDQEEKPKEAPADEKKEKIQKQENPVDEK